MAGLALRVKTAQQAPSHDDSYLQLRALLKTTGATRTVTTTSYLPNDTHAQKQRYEDEHQRARGCDAADNHVQLVTDNPDLLPALHSDAETATSTITSTSSRSTTCTNTGTSSRSTRCTNTSTSARSPTCTNTNTSPRSPTFTTMVSTSAS